MRKSYFLYGLVLVVMSSVFFADLTLGSEVRTLELFPIIDSFVSYTSPQSNYGKELYLRTEYENKTVIEAITFDINRASRRVMDVSLPKNGKITGSFSVAGGSINFRIRNEAETATYVDKTTVESLDFSFVASYTGDYRLSFENLGWLAPTVTVSLSDVILTMEPFGVTCSPIFLLFDLSLIPTEATINTAELSLSFKSAGANNYNIVKAFYCSKIDWSEQLITYENAPLSQSYLIESSSLNMSSISAGTRFKFDIKPDVVRSLPNRRLTEIVAIVSGELPSGMVEFYSRESENAPKLEMTYTYVSTTCSLSSMILIEGQSVAAHVTTDPFQSIGNIEIQYSADQVNWISAGESSGGTTDYAWKPSVWQTYVRGVWEIQLSGGTYYARSPASTLYVIPMYLLVVIPVSIIVVAAGIFLWRKRRQRNPPTSPQPVAQS